MRLTRQLAFAAIAIISVACGGMSPTAPSAVSSPSIETPGESGLVGAKDQDFAAPGCREITEVKLMLREPPMGANPDIKATYLRVGAPVRCKLAPTWTSRPNQRLMSTRNPFVVSVVRTMPPTAVTVFATAPNGVRGSIEVR